MSTLGALYQLLGQNMPQPYAEGLKTVLGNERQETASQTDLIRLAELQRAQETEARMREYFRTHPEAALGGGMPQGQQSTLGGGGPMMQQQVMPGQPPGAPQRVPGGQDLSRYAEVSPHGGGPIPPGVAMQVMPTSTPPQSTLGAPGPPGPQQQGQDPLLALARTDPDAAMAVQGRMLKIQEGRLNKTLGEAEYAARWLQGVKTPQDYARAKEDLARVLPEYAASLPQTYSQEALEPFIARATDVSQRAKMQVDEIKARADQIRAGLAGRTDAVNTELEIMGLAPASVSSLAQQGDPQAKAQLAEATNRAEQRQVRIHKAGVTPQVVEGEGNVKYLVDPHTGERRPIPGGPPGTATTGAGGTTTSEPMRGPMTEGQSKTAGYTSRMQTGNDQLSALEKSGDYTSWKAPLAQLPGGRLLLSDKQKEYEAAKGIFLTGLLRYDSAGQITPAEWKQYGDLYFPQPDDPPSVVELKRKHRAQAITTHQEMLGRPLPGQQAGTQGQPTSQAPAAAGGQGAYKPVGQMSREERTAERDALRRKAGM